MQDKTRDVVLEPRTASELGEGLRRLRGGIPLRQFVGKSGFSRSQISAFESGVRLPSLELAEGLDRLYGGESWVATSIRTLRRSSWDPWRSERGASQQHAFAWHAAYGGATWIKLIPQTQHVGEEHQLTSEWGPWGRTDTLVLPRTGVVLATGKAVDRDGIARTYNLQVLPPAFALAGMGSDLTGEDVRDVRRGWAIVNTEATNTERGHGPGAAVAE